MNLRNSIDSTKALRSIEPANQHVNLQINNYIQPIPIMVTKTNAEHLRGEFPSLNGWQIIDYNGDISDPEGNIIAYFRKALIPQQKVKEWTKAFEKIPTANGLRGCSCRPDSPSIFILSLNAGGVGLNLTAASRVMHFDRWGNPAIEKSGN